MKAFRFDHMKERAKRAFLERHPIGSPFPSEAQFLALVASLEEPPTQANRPRVILEEWQDYGLNLIENWDIRLCMKLVECFPIILPEPYRKRRPTCDYDERGEWVLIFE